jgi:hypothetical protein
MSEPDKSRWPWNVDSEDNYIEPYDEYEDVKPKKDNWDYD